MCVGKGFAPYEAWLGKAIEFKAKVKLHGQNGAVNITADGYNVQSRSQFIPKTGKVSLRHAPRTSSLLESAD